MMQQISYKASL